MQVKEVVGKENAAEVRVGEEETGYNEEETDSQMNTPAFPQTPRGLGGRLQ